MSIRGYSSPFDLGHRALRDFFTGTIYIQEKIDGSQFSFSKIDGNLEARSRNQPIHDFENAGMFQEAIDVVVDLFRRQLLIEGWVYRCEYLSKPRHNTMRYGRIPHNHLMLFDIDRGNQDYILPANLHPIAELLGIEAMPYLGMFTEKPSLEHLVEFLERDSVLGNVKIEGIVLKNYAQYGPGNKVLMAKLVGEDFKETHTEEWKKNNPTSKNFIDDIIQELATEARWTKAVQHLREAGELKYEPQDIPLLFREVNKDIIEECTEMLKERLFKHFWKQIARGLTRGLPEWYKRLLAREALDETDS